MSFSIFYLYLGLFLCYIHLKMNSSLAIKTIPINGSCIEAFSTRLMTKNLVVLKGSKGYVMCGYLNMRVAEKFKDAAVKITGVSTIEDALNATVHSCSSAARKLGIKKGQPIKTVLPLIA